MNFLLVASILFIFTIFNPSIAAVDLTCPTGTITNSTIKGAFPAAGISLFPANYSCVIKFLIPHGYAVKMNIQTNLLSTSPDHFVIKDSASTLYEMSIITNLFYLPVGTNSVNITTVTNTSTFFFDWEFIDVTNFKRNQFTTGSIVSMNLTANNYYQFISSNDQVVFHTGSISGTPDLGTRYIYVYDGEDLNAMFAGNLYDGYLPNGSKGKSLTLVNFYGKPVLSYGLANDYMAVIGYRDYSLQILSKERDFYSTGKSALGTQSAMTLYSMDAQESYISYLRFNDNKTSGQEFRVSPQLPMDKFGTLLTYTLADMSLISLPQLVLTDTFTITFYQCDTYFGIRTRPSLDWTTVGPGRSGMIISPSAWNPKLTQTIPYSVNLTSSIPVKFVFDLQSVVIGTPEDSIKVDVGSSSSSSMVAQLSQTSKNVAQKSAVGNYMTTTFTGTTGASSFIMKFDVQENGSSVSKVFRFAVLTSILLRLL